MTRNKAAETSAFVVTGGAAAAPAKASSLKPKTSRSRKATADMESPVPASSVEVASSTEVPLESKIRTSKPKTPRAKSTAVTHRHKKLEIAITPETLVEAQTLVAAPVAPVAMPAEPSGEEIAALAYSYYVERGYRDGDTAQDWFRAVNELRSRNAQ